MRAIAEADMLCPEHAPSFVVQVLEAVLEAGNTGARVCL